MRRLASIAPIDLACLALALAILAGCGSGDPPASATPETPEQPGVEAYRGQAGGDVALPSDLPEFVPLFPGARPAAHVLSQGSGSLLLLLADAEPERVLDFYRGRLADDGWEIRDTSSTGSGTLLKARRGQDRLSVAVEPSGEGSRIDLAFGNAD